MTDDTRPPKPAVPAVNEGESPSDEDEAIQPESPSGENAVIELEMPVQEDVYESIESYDEQQIGLDRFAEIITEHYFGPYPHPQLLADYDAIYPGFAQQLIDERNEEQKHRHTMERKQIAIISRGQRFAFGLGILSMVVVAYIAYLGFAWAGVAAFFISISSLAGLFLRRPPSAD